MYARHRAAVISDDLSVDKFGELLQERCHPCLPLVPGIPQAHATGHLKDQESLSTESHQ